MMSRIVNGSRRYPPLTPASFQSVTSARYASLTPPLGPSRHVRRFAYVPNYTTYRANKGDVALIAELVRATQTDRVIFAYLTGDTQPL